jgi:ABC-type transport system involved in multi-copper enzyme maturation permease subunit
MLHLLKLEWLKIKNYRTFWILFILYLISIIGANYIVYVIQDAVFHEELRKNPQGDVIKWLIGNPPYEFPQVWQMVSQISSYLLIIPGLLTIILFTNEFSFKTHRQNLIDGLTRSQFITSKILFVLAMSVVATLMVALTALIFGYIGDKPFTTYKMEYIGYAFLQCLNYCLFALLFSVLFKRSGIAIGVYFLYVVILENILFMVIRYYLQHVGYFLPVESADALITAPVFEGIQEAYISRPDFKYLLIACIAYIGLFALLSYRKFQKDDL